VIATGSASEWQHIFRGASFRDGGGGPDDPGGPRSSDQKSFIDRGVPAVQIFNPTHTRTTHRRATTADKGRWRGLVKVATFVKEGIVYLGSASSRSRHDRAMKGVGGVPSVTGIRGGAPAAGPPPAGAGQGPARELRTMPDFAFAGPA